MFMVIIEQMKGKKGHYDYHLYNTREEAYSLQEELKRSFPCATVATIKWDIEDTTPRDWLTNYYKNNVAYSKMRHADLISREIL
jgi:hypothetical protein